LKLNVCRSNLYTSHSPMIFGGVSFFVMMI
jgi:hypothetical protein